MNDWSNARQVPVEVVFGGCHPDHRTVDLCVEAARSAGLHSRRIDACEVLVREHLHQTEIRIDVRSAEGEVIVERFAATPSETQLRSALRSAFARVARGMDAARGLHTGGEQLVETSPLPAEPPSCVWYG
jgi:hypothetical protein